MTRTPTLTDRQARPLLDQLFDEPLLASPAADEIVDDFLHRSGGLAKLLLNRSAADMILTYPDREQTHLTQHFVRIADRLREGIARPGQEVSDAKLVLARHDTETARARAQQAEEKLLKSTIDLEVARQLRQMASSQPRTNTVLDAVYGGEVQELVQASEESTAKTRIQKKPKFLTIETLFLADNAIGDKSYTEQTNSQVRVTFRLLVELVGDKQVDEYTGADAGEFRPLLLRIPASHCKGGRVDAIQAIRMADAKEAASGAKIGRLSFKTAKRHFSALSQVWQWLIPRGHVEKNVFRGFEFPGTKTRCMVPG